MKTERWVVRSAYGVFYDVGIFNINVFPRFNPPFYDLSYYANTRHEYHSEHPQPAGHRDRGAQHDRS